MLKSKSFRDYKLGAFDLDGTLIDDNEELFHEVINGLKHTKSIGLDLLIVTGRTLSAFQSLELPQEFYEQFNPDIILNNGNVIYNVKTRDYQILNKIKSESFAAIYSGLTDDVDFVIEINGIHYSTSKEAKLKYNSIFKTKRAFIRNFEIKDIDQTLITEIVIFPKKKEYDCSNVLEKVDENKKYIDLYNTSVIEPKRTCKGEGIKRILEDSSLTLDDVFVCGNDVNDIGMISKCRTGIAVRNSSTKLIQYSDYHLEEDIGQFLLSLER